MGTVGNMPSESDPAGTPKTTVPQAGPAADFSNDYAASSVGVYPNPGMAETAALVAAGVAETAAAARDLMAQAHSFIAQNGSGVLSGHEPVHTAPAQIAGDASGVVRDAGT